MKSMSNRAALLFVCLASCGGGPECDKDDRHGTYLLTYTELSGNCGPVGPVVVQMGGAGGSGCVSFHAEYSDDQCTLDSDTQCSLNGQSVRVIGTTTQEDDEADLITGTASFNITEQGSGDPICYSTYDLRYERQ
jgi:hypothetical protein